MEESKFEAEVRATTEFVAAHIEPILLYVQIGLLVGYLILALSHLLDRVSSRTRFVMAGLVATLSGGWIAETFLVNRSVSFRELLISLIIFGSTLYVFLGEWLLLSLAGQLTLWRGEKWVKEIDYIYLMLGAVGIAGSINRLDSITGRFERADWVGLLVLTVAIVIRLIKTRAEIAGWNTLKFHCGHISGRSADSDNDSTIPPPPQC
jgi:hypothetical protein